VADWRFTPARAVPVRCPSCRSPGRGLSGQVRATEARQSSPSRSERTRLGMAKGGGTSTSNACRRSFVFAAARSRWIGRASMGILDTGEASRRTAISQSVPCVIVSCASKGWKPRSRRPKRKFDFHGGLGKQDEPSPASIGPSDFKVSAVIRPSSVPSHLLYLSSVLPRHVVLVHLSKGLFNLVLLPAQWSLVTGQCSSEATALFRYKIDFDIVTFLFVFNKILFSYELTRFKKFVSQFIDKLYN
jgi:hypothetical protein